MLQLMRSCQNAGSRSIHVKAANYSTPVENSSALTRIGDLGGKLSGLGISLLYSVEKQGSNPVPLLLMILFFRHGFGIASS